MPKHLVPDIMCLVVRHQRVEVLLALALVELEDPSLQVNILETLVVHLLGQHLVVPLARLPQGLDQPRVEVPVLEVVN